MQIDTHEISNPDLLVKNPRVSVLMITYNHENYLSEAIDGVINQQSEFPFELIIGEDASSDSTLRVAIEYQRKYPEIIRIIHSSSNVGMHANSLRIFKKARGEYIAYCEGDDFWCDPDKIARQVKMMENDRKFGIVHSDWTRSYLSGDKWKYNFSRSVHSRVPMRYLSGDIFATWHYPKILRTCTILLRKDTMDEWYSSGLLNPNYHFGDSVLSSWITSRFMVGYIPAVMAVYRVSPNSALRSGAKARVAFYKSALEFDTAARAFFSKQGNYCPGFRWDSAAGLLLWGLRARDYSAVRIALADFRQHFNFYSFIVTGYQTIAMRLPTLRRQPRTSPGHASKAEQTC